MIDLHCHYLPGVDDGAPDLETALNLARAAADNGILIAVLTPHVMAGRWDNRRSTLEPAFEAFRRSVDDAGIPLELYLGAEVHLMPASLGLLEVDELPVLGRWEGERVILLELPDGGVPVGAMKAVEILRRHGAVPMLAHPERNRSIMRDISRLEPFVDAGCLVQLTAASVCGWFGAPAKRAAQEILDAGWATAVATDAHNLRHRPPVLAEARHALTLRYGEDTARELTELNPLLIVAGRDDAALPAERDIEAVPPA
ncbi:MAG: CpsB/CapC family capsule biosynthesis tyrosine phosphatase [Burkholderiales bacterium]